LLYLGNITGDHLEWRLQPAQTEAVKIHRNAGGNKRVSPALSSCDLDLGTVSNVVAESARFLHRSCSRDRRMNSGLCDKPVERGVNRARVSAIKFFYYLIGYLPRFPYICYFIKTNYITLVHSHWLRTDSFVSLVLLSAGVRKGFCTEPKVGPFAIQVGRPWALGGRSRSVHRMTGAAFIAVLAAVREQGWIEACRNRAIHSSLDHSPFAPQRYIDPGLKHYSPDRFTVGFSECRVSRKRQPVSAVSANRKNMQEEARTSS